MEVNWKAQKGIVMGRGDGAGKGSLNRFRQGEMKERRDAEKELKGTPHLEQTKPLMFSTTPMIGSFTFLQKLISFRTSNSATSYNTRDKREGERRGKGGEGDTCGVVTMTAPSGLASLRYWAIDRCSSLVPGGVSTTR